MYPHLASVIMICIVDPGTLTFPHVHLTISSSYDHPFTRHCKHYPYLSLILYHDLHSISHPHPSSRLHTPLTSSLCLVISDSLVLLLDLLLLLRLSIFSRIPPSPPFHCSLFSESYTYARRTVFTLITTVDCPHHCMLYSYHAANSTVYVASTRPVQYTFGVPSTSLGTWDPPRLVPTLAVRCQMPAGGSQSGAGGALCHYWFPSQDRALVSMFRKTNVSLPPEPVPMEADTLRRRTGHESTRCKSGPRWVGTSNANNNACYIGQMEEYKCLA
ncbi:hypothetical protein BD311DRAFT_748626 [Dichomitus squalens]|uniref:Uncharacterized protein n=1 Tax=Dichomitus squalens TaxID=114155 RepID=A0A4Q9N3U6_9APHY|nr:hypothetical protein BD311DRAFT_748626 [Dichomitus squalens]